jgi:hypothetical protein
MPAIISRKDAISQGLNKYFTGVPCKKNHNAERYVQSGTCEECIRESRQIIISQPRGEILSPEKPQLSQRFQLQLSIQQQKIALRQQALSLQIQARAEREERRQRKSLAHTRLVDVILFIDPLDYDGITMMVWAYAAQRIPLLKLEDVVTGRELSDNRFVLRCFPEDKAEILRISGEMHARRNQAGAAEIEQKRLAIVTALQLEAENNGQPAGDPT